MNKRLRPNAGKLCMRNIIENYFIFSLYPSGWYQRLNDMFQLTKIKMSCSFDDKKETHYSCP